MFGSNKFLIIYVGAGALANLMTFFMGKSPLSLGGSGCTFGLMGAMAAYFYFNRRTLGARSDMVLESIKRTVLMNLLYGGMHSNVDNFAHIGGFLGSLCYYFSIIYYFCSNDINNCFFF
jgi:rhomboid protease GluP